MLAGKLSGYCTRLFGTNCWAEQTAFAARGDAYDEFTVRPSELTIEGELEALLETDEATRADMAVALRRLRSEVAERERVEAALRDSEEKYRAIVEDQTELICRFRPDGTLTFVNEAYCRYFGRSADELVGSDCTPMIPLEDRECVERHFAPFSAQRPVATLEHRVLLPGGEVRWHQWTNRAILDGDRVVEFQGVGRDVTERRLAEEERERLEEQLRQSQKMEAIGRLAGGVAHDFNNILTIIGGNAELIGNSLGEQHPLQTLVREIGEATRRAASLTSQLLAFGRRQLGIPRRVQPDRDLEDSLKMLSRIVGDDVELEFRPGSAPWCIEVDPAQLDQILVNLVVNARDAMPDGGRIVIETARAPGALDGPEGAREDAVLLVVSDSGAGMEPGTRERVFEPFFSTKEDSGGTGLGLATVYGIVTQSGGTIEVESVPGAGTTFRVAFPRSAGEAEPAPHQARPRAAGGSETVLLTEDDEAVRALVRRTLAQHGYAVLACASGREALEVAGTHAAPIDLLVTDVMMPRMNGLELFAALREQRPELRAVFLSGYTDDLVPTWGDATVSTRFLAKPFRHEELLREVRELLDERRADRPTS